MRLTGLFMKLAFKSLACALLLVLGAGCASTSQHASAATGPTASCEVCRYNNDLACVCVRVKETTPSTVYAGETYYFCSEDCRAEFQKKPAKYTGKHTRASR